MQLVACLPACPVLLLHGDNHDQARVRGCSPAGWWYKPDYIINDININSAIACPAHDELVTLSGKNASVTVSGYAYSGAPSIPVNASSLCMCLREATWCCSILPTVPLVMQNCTIDHDGC